MTEPDYRYEATGFHGAMAAAAAPEGRGLLFKVEASGRKTDALPALAKATAGVVWAFRQKK